MGAFARTRREWFESSASIMLFLYFAFAAVMTLQLAATELRRIQTQEIQPETPESLYSAVVANPRDSAAWIALGLAAERERDLPRAAQYFAGAESVDRRYLPAWSSANFYFRHGDAEHFWSAAARASAMIYDDPKPLIALADRMESDPVAALDRMKAPPVLERAYLDFLIGQRRWDSANKVAVRIFARRDPADVNRLRDFTIRVRDAGRGDLAAPFCRGTKDCDERF